MTDLQEESLIALSLPAIEQEFIRLAGPNVIRYVRTIEGSEFYGLPVGAPIKPDVLEKKNQAAAFLGMKVPSDGIGDEQGNVVPNSAPKLDLSIKKNPLKGPSKFSVGGAQYEAPKGSRLIKSKHGDGIRYVVTPDGKVYVYNAEGSIDLPGNVAKALATRFEDLSDDPDYAEDQFEAQAASGDVSTIAVDGVLVDSHGRPQFKKIDDDTFEAIQVPGLQVKAKDLKPMLDEGSLVPEQGEQADATESAFDGDQTKNFAAMSQTDFEEFLTNAPVGYALHQTGQSGTSIQFVKNEDGTWATTSLDNDPFNVPYQSLAALRTVLKTGPAPQTEEDEPDAPEEPVTPPAPNETNTATEPTPTPPPPAPEDPAGEEVKKPDAAPENAVQVENILSIESGQTIWVQDGGDEFEWGDQYTLTPAGSDTWTDDLNDLTWDFSSLQDILDAGGTLWVEPTSEPSTIVPPKPYQSMSGQDLIDDTSLDLLTAKDLKRLPDGEPFYFAQDNGITTLFKDGDAFREVMPSGSVDTYYQGDPFVMDADADKGRLYGAKKYSTWDETYEEYGGLATKPAPDFPATATLGATIIQGGAEPWYWTKTGNDEWSGKKTDFATVEQKLNNALMTEHLDALGAVVPITKTDEMVSLAPPYVPYSADVSLESLLNAPIGARVQTETGGFPWTKVADNLWVNPLKEVVLDAPDFRDLIKSFSNLNWVFDATSPNPQATTLEPGTVMKSIEQVEALPDGSALHHAPTDGTFIKTGDQLQQVGYSYSQPIHNFPSSINSGQFTLMSLPGMTDESSPAIQAEPGGTAYSVEDMKAAIDALEAHSSFQIKYGLNSVPDNPIAKDQADIAEAAKAEFPHLPAKPAFVAYLKKKAGIETGSSASGVSVNIGAHESPKDTKTGLTGGVFDLNDVKDAISILESFDGKVFKSELNKKGNPLGTLSPNDIVGFDKDKTVTKQKFIDLLKQKVAAADSSPEPEAVDSNAPAEAPKTDWAEKIDVPVAGKVGDKFTVKMKSSPEPKVFEKKSEDEYFGTGEGMYYAMSLGNAAESIEPYIEPEPEPAVPNEDWTGALVDGPPPIPETGGVPVNAAMVANALSSDAVAYLGTDGYYWPAVKKQDND